MTITMKRIKREITTQQISQKQLAERIGVSPVTVCRWMNGTRQPDIDEVEKMVLALGLHLLIYRE